ncbi:hypothetical protein HN662_04815 [Candidatus Woesearchaeota archaeon]|nr:hypothetical protein [Candidatus Woesearchaeota archaeon]
MNARDLEADRLGALQGLRDRSFGIGWSKHFSKSRSEVEGGEFASQISKDYKRVLGFKVHGPLITLITSSDVAELLDEETEIKHARKVPEKIWNICFDLIKEIKHNTIAKEIKIVLALPFKGRGTDYLIHFLSKRNLFPNVVAVLREQLKEKKVNAGCYVAAEPSGYIVLNFLLVFLYLLEGGEIELKAFIRHALVHEIGHLVHEKNQFKNRNLDKIGRRDRRNDDVIRLKLAVDSLGVDDAAEERRALVVDLIKQSQKLFDYLDGFKDYILREGFAEFFETIFKSTEDIHAVRTVCRTKALEELEKVESVVTKAAEVLSGLKGAADTVVRGTAKQVEQFKKTSSNYLDCLVSINAHWQGRVIGAHIFVEVYYSNTTSAVRDIEELVKLSLVELFDLYKKSVSRPLILNHGSARFTFSKWVGRLNKSRKGL